MSPLQRLDTRYGVALRADCITRDTFVAHRVSNISRGGLFLQGTALPIDSELQLRLYLDEHDVMPVRARVVWNHELRVGTPHYVRGMGMQFVGLTSDEVRRLDAYLKKLAVQSSPKAPATRH